MVVNGKRRDRAYAVSDAVRRPVGRVAVALAALVLPAAAVLLPGSAARAAITPALGVHLTVGHSGKCMAVKGASTVNNAAIVQFACGTATNEDWRAVPMGDGTYELVATNSGKCVTVVGVSTVNNAGIVQFTCSTGPSAGKGDRWRPRPVPGTNRVQLVAEHSGKCLHVVGASTADDAVLLQFTCGSPAAAKEQWYAAPAAAQQPQVLVDMFAPTSVLQATATGTSLGALEYAYTDNLGRLRHGHQPDPTRYDLVEWSTASGNQAYSGRPGLAQRADGRIQVVAHNTDSDVWLFSQTAAGAATWDTGVDVGGSTIGRPALARLESGELVAFAFDAAGGLWRNSLANAQAPFMGWRYVGGSGLVGTPAVALTATGFRLFALDAAGALHTATYAGGALSDWSSLGGTGLNGQPAVVLYPGYRLRVFARAADGTIVTKMQDPTGVFEADWQPVGTFATAGSPAAILDPALGRVAVVARGADNEVYRVFETGQLTGAWGTWDRINPDVSDPTATDVTLAPFTGGGSGESWIIVFRNQNDATRVYERQLPSAGVTAAKAATASDVPTFTGHSLPTPPAG